MTPEAVGRPADEVADEAGSTSPGRGASIAERRRLVSESLQVGILGNNARVLPEHADPRIECQIELEVERIEPYRNNPRRALNPRFEEIKASIREVGVRSPLTVTRRPGDGHFIVESGGNTRLLAMRQLWEETRDPRFQRLTVLFRPWQSDRHVLSAHLIENELRGELSFWDKATGVHALKGFIEAEGQGEISLRELAAELSRLGFTATPGTLSHWLFAAERLAILGAAIPTLSGLDVRTLQPRLNALKRYVHARLAMPEGLFYSFVLTPVFEAAAKRFVEKSEFDVLALYGACEAAVAEHTGVSIAELRGMVGAFGDSSGESVQPPALVALARTGEEPVGEAIPEGEDDLPQPERSSAEDGSRASGVGGQADAARLGRLARAAAIAAGIANCLAFDDRHPQGLRLEELPADEDRASVRSRAWGLLAGLLGQAPSSERPIMLDGAFIAWLTDERDAVASACWDALCAARALPRLPDKRGSEEAS